MDKKNLAQHPKYRIAELLRSMYGELNIKKGAATLIKHCGLRNERTVTTWMKIPAGSSEGIHDLVLNRVLDFFKLQNESQLFTSEHKLMLKDTVPMKSTPRKKQRA